MCESRAVFQSIWLRETMSWYRPCGRVTPSSLDVPFGPTETYRRRRSADGPTHARRTGTNASARSTRAWLSFDQPASAAGRVQRPARAALGPTDRARQPASAVRLHIAAQTLIRDATSLSNRIARAARRAKPGPRPRAGRPALQATSGLLAKLKILRDPERASRLGEGRGGGGAQQSRRALRRWALHAPRGSATARPIRASSGKRVGRDWDAAGPAPS
jgi:hypothetical protein